MPVSVSIQAGCHGQLFSYCPSALPYPRISSITKWQDNISRPKHQPEKLLLTIAGASRISKASTDSLRHISQRNPRPTSVWQVDCQKLCSRQRALRLLKTARSYLPLKLRHESLNCRWNVRNNFPFKRPNLHVKTASAVLPWTLERSNIHSQHSYF